MIARRPFRFLWLGALASITAVSATAAAQQPTASPPPAPYDPSMQAGGLAPPPPMQQPAPAAPATTDTAQQLDEAKEKDSGRGLELIWLNAEGGFEQVGLSTFKINEQQLTAGFIDSSSSGGVVGAGLGLRLLFLTLGARGRVGFFKDYQLFTLGGELGAHVPLGRLDPHIDLGFGYAGLGNFKSAVQGAADAISIRGYYARVSGGVDVYLTPIFSIGVNVSGDLLGLTRPALSATEIARIEKDPAADPKRTQAAILSTDGTSFGGAFALTGVLGLHF